MTSYRSKYSPGDKVIVGGDIEGFITAVKFTYGRTEAIYTVEWFNNGAMHSNDFFEKQLQPIS